MIKAKIGIVSKIELYLASWFYNLLCGTKSSMKTARDPKGIYNYIYLEVDEEDMEKLSFPLGMVLRRDHYKLAYIIDNELHTAGNLDSDNLALSADIDPWTGEWDINFRIDLIFRERIEHGE